VRGSGKSSFLEHTAIQYLEHGHGVFDLFGSRDGEGLAWLRSEFAKDKKVLLLRGENIDVESSFPCKSAEAVTLEDFQNNDIVISASPLYFNIDQEFSYAARLTDLLYRRIHYKKLIFLICREAANFYYSRLKVSDNQTYAKAQMVYILRESRHVGIAFGLDSIRYYAIDIDIRSLSDYLILKSQGIQGLTKDLKWLYRYVNPGLLRHMGPQQFIMVSGRGAIGYGYFPYPEWHKKEKEDILSNLGIKVTYGEQLEEAILKGTYKTVGDKEHAEIIRLWVEDRLSMVKIGVRLHRSSRTPMIHIDAHNQAVRRSGFCASCKRVGSPYFDKEATREEPIVVS